MNTLLVTAVLALGAADEPAKKDAPALDGKWVIVYAEEGGRRNNSWEQRQATIKGDTLSYEAEGEERAYRLTFGPNQALTVTGTDKDKKSLKGVCIVAQDYICISLITGGKGTGGKEPGAEKDAGPPKHKSSGDFILILRRQRGR